MQKSELIRFCFNVHKKNISTEVILFLNILPVRACLPICTAGKRTTESTPHLISTPSTLSYSSEYPSRTTYTLSWWSLVSSLESFGAVCRRMQYELTAVRYCAMCHWHRSGVFIVNFKHISYLLLMFLLLDFEQVKYLQGTYSGLIPTESGNMTYGFGITGWLLFERESGWFNF